MATGKNNFNSLCILLCSKLTVITQDKGLNDIVDSTQPSKRQELETLCRSLGAKIGICLPRVKDSMGIALWLSNNSPFSLFISKGNSIHWPFSLTVSTPCHSTVLAGLLGLGIHDPSWICRKEQQHKRKSSCLLSVLWPIVQVSSSRLLVVPVFPPMQTSSQMSSNWIVGMVCSQLAQLPLVRETILECYC